MCIIEDIIEVENLKSNILKGLVEEFRYVIYEDKNNIYSSTLYILSNNYIKYNLLNREGYDNNIDILNKIFEN